MTAENYDQSMESRFVLVMCLIQFFNILDFMMVMPLGPDLAQALTIELKDIGLIGGSYTFAAAFSGLLASLFLDKYNRKSALLVSLMGLNIATALCALSWDAPSLIITRIFAGVFGGLLSSLSFAMIADLIPGNRRGTAIGKVMAGFSLASILGVPFGLELSKYLGWRGPFFAITCLGVIIFLLALKFLPQAHNKISTLDFRTRVLNILTSFKSTKSLYAFTYTLLAMISGFMIIPNISTYLQLNLGYPRASLGILYFCGGMFTFFTMRYVGKLADQISATIISIYSTILIIIAFSGFIGHSPVPVVIIFIITMVSLSSRNVLLQTISSKIPTSDERGGFMSIISFFTHMGSSCGAFIASLMLSTSVTGAKLEGMTEVASVSLFLSCLIPFLLYLTERKLKISYVS